MPGAWHEPKVLSVQNIDSKGRTLRAFASAPALPSPEADRRP